MQKTKKQKNEKQKQSNKAAGKLHDGAEKSQAPKEKAAAAAKREKGKKKAQKQVERSDDESESASLEEEADEEDEEEEEESDGDARPKKHLTRRGSPLCPAPGSAPLRARRSFIAQSFILGRGRSH